MYDASLRYSSTKISYSIVQICINALRLPYNATKRISVWFFFTLFILGPPKSCRRISFLLDMPYTSDYAGGFQSTYPTTVIQFSKGKGNKDNVIVADNRFRKDK